MLKITSFGLILSGVGELGNLKEPLLIYRTHGSQISKRKASAQQNVSDKIRLIQLRRLLINVSPEKSSFHFPAFMKGLIEADPSEIIEWTTNLIYENSLKNAMPEPEFTRFLLGKICECLGSNRKQGLRTLVLERMKNKVKIALGINESEKRQDAYERRESEPDFTTEAAVAYISPA